MPDNYDDNYERCQERRGRVWNPGKIYLFKPYLFLVLILGTDRRRAMGQTADGPEPVRQLS